MNTKRRGTVIWGGLLIVSTLAILAMVFVGRDTNGINEQRDGAQAHGDFAPDSLLHMPPEQIAAVELIANGSRHRFERGDRKGRWSYHGHSHASQEKDGQNMHRHSGTTTNYASSKIAQAVEMFSRVKSDRVVANEAEVQRDRFGLTKPTMIAMVYSGLGLRPIVTLNIGNKTPDGLGRYVWVGEKRTIEIIPDFHLRNLLQLIEAQS